MGLIMLQLNEGYFYHQNKKKKKRQASIEHKKHEKFNYKYKFAAQNVEY